MCTWPWGQKHEILLELELHVGASCLNWVLAAKLSSL